MPTRDDVVREIDKLSDLPILPQILVTLNKVADDDNASAEDLGKIILKDQGLTLQVLKVVNSAFYRAQKRERTTTVSQAVIILGFNGIRRLALGMSVYDMFKSASGLPGLQDLWSHSLTVAITARLLAARTGYHPVEEAFVAGLVHDIGRALLARCDPELYGRLIAETGDSQLLRNRERELFGMSHAMAGKRLAHRWALPSGLEEVIGGHHALETTALAAASPLTKIVAGANQFAHVLMSNPDRDTLQRAMEEIDATFGLNVLQVQEIYHGIWREYAELAKAFEIPDNAWDPRGGAGSFRPDIDREELLTRLQGIAAAMVAPDAAGRVPGIILDGILASVAVERLFLLLLEDDGRTLACRASRGAATPAQEQGFRLAVAPDQGVTARTVLERRAFHIPDVEAPGTRHYLNQELVTLLETRGFATVPLLYRGEPIGVLWFDNPRSQRPLTEPLREAVGTFANSLALALGPLSPQPARA